MFKEYSYSKVDGIIEKHNSNKEYNDVYFAHAKTNSTSAASEEWKTDTSRKSVGFRSIPRAEQVEDIIAVKVDMSRTSSV